MESLELRAGREIVRIKTLMRKVSFGGDTSEAGRYAANMRWKDHVKGGDKTVDASRLTSAPPITKEMKKDLERVGLLHEQTKNQSDDWEDIDYTLMAWRRFGTEPIQRALRSGMKDLDSNEKEVIDAFNQMWTELAVPTKTDLVLFRGLATGDNSGDLATMFKEGQIISDKGWQHTTVNPFFAHDWASDATIDPKVPPIVLVIKVPAGTKIVNMGHLTMLDYESYGNDVNKPGGGTGQEILLNKGTKFRVVSVSKVNDGDNWAKRKELRSQGGKNPLRSTTIVEVEVVQ